MHELSEKDKVVDRNQSMPLIKNLGHESPNTLGGVQCCAFKGMTLRGTNLKALPLRNLDSDSGWGCWVCWVKRPDSALSRTEPGRAAPGHSCVGHLGPSQGLLSSLAAAVQTEPGRIVGIPRPRSLAGSLTRSLAPRGEVTALLSKLHEHTSGSSKRDVPLRQRNETKRWR